MTENDNNRSNLQSQLDVVTDLYSSSKTRLKPRHISDFQRPKAECNNEVDDDENCNTVDLFYEFARTVCLASAVQRKEVLEAWAMALHVFSIMFQSTECNVTRFADLACSHGLVSWALLLLLDRDRERKQSTEGNNDANTIGSEDNNGKVSAVCVDIRMPPSAEKIARVFLKEYPQFEGRWDYVEGSVDAIQPASTCLLLGVHACGTLSDRIVQLSIKGNSPLALVPCCHSKKSLTDEQIADPMFLAGGDSKSFLSEFLDQYRIRQLSKAEFHVTEEYLPESITPKNRLILAFPPQTNIAVDTTDTKTIVPVISHMLKAYQMPKIAIPVADTTKAKSIVKSMAGRDAALERRKSPSPLFSFTTVVTPPKEPVTKLQLLEWVNTIYTNIDNENNNIDTIDSKTVQNSTTSQIDIENVNKEPYIQPKTGNSMMTYQFIYPRGMDKQTAKQLHIEFCHQLPVMFPGVWAHQIPR